MTETEYLRVSESFLGCGGRSVDSLKHRASTMTSHGVAHSAEVLEDLLSLTSITGGLLLLWWHYGFNAYGYMLLKNILQLTVSCCYICESEYIYV